MTTIYYVYLVDRFGNRITKRIYLRKFYALKYLRDSLSRFPQSFIREINLLY